MSASSVAPVVPAPKSRKRPVKRLATYIVILRGRIVFEHETLSGATAWRDAFGSGAVYSREPVARKAVRP